MNVYYESLQLTISMHKAQDNGLVDDVNAMHAYGRSSAPIAHELVYDKCTSCFWAERIKVKGNGYLRAELCTRRSRAGV